MCQLNGDALGRRRGRGDLPAGEEAKHGDDDRRRCGDLRRRGEQARNDRPAENREIGAGFDKPCAAEHFVVREVLGQGSRI